MEKIADAINILGEFCGVRNVENLAQLAGKKFDIAVLFGGSILAGGDIFAEVIKKNLAKKNIIVGGAGHTTESLRKKNVRRLAEKFFRTSDGG